LRSCSELAGQGYTLTVTRIDRLALSVADLAAIVHELESKGGRPQDNREANRHVDGGRSRLPADAGCVRAIRRERQLEGKEAAKAKNIYKGRPAPIKSEAVAALEAERLGIREIARRIKIGRASVYRVAS
jgi:DNA invertase Pin-like site-specific DNA recombinase